mgnify:CR=1 FL=1
MASSHADCENVAIPKLRYKDILEHVPYEMGRMYAHFLKTDYPELLEDPAFKAAVFAAADTGAPETHAFEGLFDNQRVSPTQLRYLKHLGDLRRLSGLEGKRVVEVGCGYGGQAQIALAAADAPRAST